MLDFCAEHGIAAEIETIPASDINAAYERVPASDVRYRFVIDAATCPGRRGRGGGSAAARRRQVDRSGDGELVLPHLDSSDLGESGLGEDRIESSRRCCV